MNEVIIDKKFDTNRNYCDICHLWKENVVDITCNQGFEHQICKECRLKRRDGG